MGSPRRLFHRRFSSWIHSNSPHLDWIGLILFHIRPGTLVPLPGTVLTSPEKWRITERMDIQLQNLKTTPEVGAKGSQINSLPQGSRDLPHGAR
ncbi:hypothetical protein PIB30_016482 [Stylosanthes scabra]|uniref:Uncharacterized protein n=1 Tax=Stylosanthes scabra TaxID=79078 RepID=A0ABU6Y622_9FABA|nr:hypothetical protein [Stylosanthes scabra]